MKTTVFIRIPIAILGCVLLVWFLLPPIMYGIFNTGNIIGLTASAVFILYSLMFRKINCFIKNTYRTRAGKTVLSALALIVASGLIFVTVLTCNMVRAATNPPDKETTVVVLGCRVREYGPGVMLRGRINAAYEFLTTNPEAKCVLSGGKGDNEPMSEALCMYNELTLMGIAPDRLYLEEASTSTRENILFSTEVIKSNSLCENITVITDSFHQYRAGKIAASLGFENYSHCTETNYVLLPCYYLRELPGIVKDMIFGR